MFLWKYMTIIFAFGAFGGVVNALLTDNGFILPKKEQQDNTKISGARWLTNEVDKKLLRAAASKAASGQPSDQKAIRISAALPAEALRIAAEQAANGQRSEDRRQMIKLENEALYLNSIL